MVKVKLVSGFVTILREAGYRLGEAYTYGVYRYGSTAVVTPRPGYEEELEIYLRLRFEAADE